MSSILTPQEQMGFIREEGKRILYMAALFLLLAAGYFFWAGPWFRDSPPERINAIFYVFYSSLGIYGGTIALCAVAGLLGFAAWKKFAKANELKRAMEKEKENAP